MAYSWVLWDLAGVPLGEVDNAYECKFSPRLNGLPTASFRIRLDNPMADAIATRNGDVLCGVYRDSTLEFIGELTTAEEVGPGYRILLDREGMLNKAHSLPAADVVDSEDTDSMTEHGRFEGVVPSDLSNVLLRKALIDAHVAARKDPRRIVTIEAISDDTKPSLACNFAGPLWRLQHRLLAKGTAEVSYNNTRGALLEQFITAANADKDTGVRIGTIATGYGMEVGPWSYKPVAEAVTELSASPTIPFEVPSSYFSSDDFNAHSAGDLTGKTADDGGVWTRLTIATSSSRDFDTQTTGGESNGPCAVRGAVVSPEDAASWDAGHFACPLGELLVDSEEVLMSLDYSCDYVGSDQHIALYARANDSPVRWTMAVVSFFDNPPTLRLIYNNAGTIATLATVSMPWFQVNTRFRLRFGIDTTGRVAIWQYDPATTPGGGPPNITAVNSLFETGGALETGACGVYHRNSSQNGNVIIDNYWHATPVLPFVAEPADFEIVPTVPTADSGQDGVVGAGLQIGTLNVPTTLGSSKPHAVFNRGDGARNNPAFGADYVLGDTAPARLKASGTTRLNATVRIHGADITRDENGRVTEVPILVPE